MSNAFGTKFILVNDIIQPLPTTVFQGGPWIHIATVVRGFKEYMAFKHELDNTIYVEEVVSNEGTLKKIEDNNEWGDLVAFLVESKVLSISIDSEIKLAKKLLFPNE